MLQFKDYLWARIRESILLYWIILVVISIIIYVGMIAFIKDRQLSSSLRVAAYTVHETMEAGEWTIALGHLTKLEENGPVFNIQLSDTRDNRSNLTGPFGERPLGIGSICKSQSVADGVNLKGCMILIGGGEAVTLLLFVMLASGLFLIVFKAFRSKIYTFIERISNELKSIGADSNIESDSKDDIVEIVSIRAYILSLINETKEASKSIALSQLSVQVAHDVRSPLTALDVVIKDIADVPEEKRIMIRNAVNRIRDIANNLLLHHRKEIIDCEKMTSSCVPSMVMSMLDSIISEKRTQYRGNTIKFDLNVDDNACAVFSSVNPVEFKRMISNLINNAVEAIVNKQGHITVSLRKQDNQALIQIDDNGIGIPENILAKLFSADVTFGKKDGNGLGLNHAFSVVNEWGGKIVISSDVNSGTTVSMMLPLANSPLWFVDTIKIPVGKSIAIFDDDPSIHHVWAQRFNEQSVDNLKADVLHFHTIHQLRDWLGKIADSKHEYIYLFDYEVVGDDQTGLDLIDEFSLRKYAILVTSRYEEKDVIDRCKDAGVRLLPKSIAAFIPIVTFQQVKYDAVLIDDDALIRATWKMSATDHGKEIKLFEDPAQFFQLHDEISRESIIYIDSNLGNGSRGEIIAEDIYEMGFMKIYLATGMPKSRFSNFPYLSGIQGKSPPWVMELEVLQ
jgi:signal transduction histidine kinase